jgi:glycosidase
MQDAVIYQVFPDRFRNGNIANDPVDGTTVYGANTCSGGACVVDLHSNWNDLPNMPSFGVDFFGGDLQGVIEKLDYLQDLGVNVIYFNPIFSASSNHGYDTNDYYAIRNYFGDNALFDTLIAQANAHGMRVILDGVYNLSLEL